MTEGERSYNPSYVNMRELPAFDCIFTGKVEKKQLSGNFCKPPLPHFDLITWIIEALVAERICIIINILHCRNELIVMWAGQSFQKQTSMWRAKLIVIELKEKRDMLGKMPITCYMHSEICTRISGLELIHLFDLESLLGSFSSDSSKSSVIYKMQSCMC